jgi:hypothetical protein
MPFDAQDSEYRGISQELTTENLSTYQHHQQQYQQQTYELFGLNIQVFPRKKKKIEFHRSIRR